MQEPPCSCVDQEKWAVDSGCDSFKYPASSNVKRRKLILIVTLAAVLGVIIYSMTSHYGRALVLTGIVTTDDVIVSSEIQGRLQQLLVKQGDIVSSNQLLALIQPQEWKADMAFYANSEQQLAAQVNQAEADLKYQESQTSNQIWQAEANLEATEEQVVQAEADLENTRLSYERFQE